MTTHCVLLPLLALLPLNHPLCSIFCAFQDDCLEKAEDCLSRHLGNELDKLDFSQSSTSIAQKNNIIKFQDQKLNHAIEK